MTSLWESGEWKATPILLRLIGKPGFRRLRTLNFYHVFSEWEYSHAAPAPAGAA